MKMKWRMFISCLLLISCKKESKPTENAITISDSIIKQDLKRNVLTSKDTFSSNRNLIEDTFLKPKREIEVNRLEYFDSSQFLLFPMHFKPEFSGYWDKMNAHLGEPINSKQEQTLRFLKRDIALEYFKADCLDTIVVIDSKQDIIDTLQCISYGWYSSGTDVYFVSIYPTDKAEDYDDFIALTIFNRTKYFNSNTFKIDSILPKAMNRYSNKTDIFFYANWQLDSGFIELVSLYDWRNHRSGTFLIANNKIIDSLQKSEHIISGLEPVPLSQNSIHTYIARLFIPETCAIWNSEIKIDFKKFKFVEVVEN